MKSHSSLRQFYLLFTLIIGLCGQVLGQNYTVSPWNGTRSEPGCPTTNDFCLVTTLSGTVKLIGQYQNQDTNSGIFNFALTRCDASTKFSTGGKFVLKTGGVCGAEIGRVDIIAQTTGNVLVFDLSNVTNVTSFYGVFLSDNGAKYHTNAITITKVQQTPAKIEVSQNIAVTPNPMVRTQAKSISVSFKNNGGSAWTGCLQLIIRSASGAENVIAETVVISLAANQSRELSDNAAVQSIAGAYTIIARKKDSNCSGVATDLQSVSVNIVEPAVALAISGVSPNPASGVQNQTNFALEATVSGGTGAAVSVQAVLTAPDNTDYPFDMSAAGGGKFTLSKTLQQIGAYKLRYVAKQGSTTAQTTQYNLTVTAPAAALAISGVAPNPASGVQNQTNFALEATVSGGTGAAVSVQAVLTAPDNTDYPFDMSAAGGGKFTLSKTLQQIGAYKLRYVAKQGSTTAQTTQYNLTVTAPASALAIAGVAPNPASGVQNQTNFALEATVSGGTGAAVSVQAVLTAPDNVDYPFEMSAAGGGKFTLAKTLQQIGAYKLRYVAKQSSTTIQTTQYNLTVTSSATSTTVQAPILTDPGNGYTFLEVPTAGITYQWKANGSPSNTKYFLRVRDEQSNELIVDNLNIGTGTSKTVTLAQHNTKLIIGHSYIWNIWAVPSDKADLKPLEDPKNIAYSVKSAEDFRFKINGSVIVATGDDYPQKYKNGNCPNYGNPLVLDKDIDIWNFYLRQCTSFVAWRMNRDAGSTALKSNDPFRNNMSSPALSNAENWAKRLGALGYPVNNTPVVGAIAQWDANYNGAGSVGHVAYVSQVFANGDIEVEEYNYVPECVYNKRIIRATVPSNFIHINSQRTITKESKLIIDGGIITPAVIVSGSNASFTAKIKNIGNDKWEGCLYMSWHKNDTNKSFIGDLDTKINGSIQPEQWITLARPDSPILSQGNASYWLIVKRQNNCTGAFEIIEEKLVKIDSKAPTPNPVPIKSEPFITIKSPSKGDLWITDIGKKFDITWNTSSDIKKLDIEYSIDNGTNWKLLSRDYPNNGFYAWAVPLSFDTKQAKIRLQSGGLSAVSSAFTISPPDVTPKVVFTNPIEGAIVYSSEKTTINWNSTLSVKSIYLKYSLDGGSNWVFINTVPIDATLGKYDWLVPDNQSQNAKIRIEDADKSTIKDERNVRIQNQTVGSSVISGLVLDVQPIWIFESNIASLKVQEPTLTNNTLKNRIMLYKGEMLLATDLDPSDGFAFGNIANASDYKIVISDDKGLLTYEYSIDKPTKGLTLKFPISLRNEIWNKVNVLEYPNYNYRIVSSKIIDGKDNQEEVFFSKGYDLGAVRNLLGQKMKITNTHATRIELEKRLLVALRAQEIFMVQGFEVLAEQKVVLGAQIEQIFTVLFSFSDIFALNSIEPGKLDKLSNLDVIKKTRYQANAFAYLKELFRLFRDEGGLALFKTSLVKGGVSEDDADFIIDTFKELDIDYELSLLDNINTSNVAELIKAFVGKIASDVGQKKFYQYTLKKFISESQVNVSNIIAENFRKESLSGTTSDALTKSIYYNESINTFDEMSEVQRSTVDIYKRVLSCGKYQLLGFEFCLSGGVWGILEGENSNSQKFLKYILNISSQFLQAVQLTRAQGKILEGILAVGEVITAGQYQIALNLTNQGYNNALNGKFATQLAFHPSSARSKKIARIGSNISVDEFKQTESQANIYPNPSEGIFKVTNIDALSNWKVYNLNGVQVQVNSTINGQELILDLRNLPTGTYLLSIISQETNSLTTTTLIKL